jgi:hypothetical protein
MAYILDVLEGKIQSRPNRITLEQYVIENSYITKYLSRIVKDKALVVYNVLFHLSYFEHGKGILSIPWTEVGSYIRSEQGNILKRGDAVTRRIGDLLRNKCISVNRQRGKANEITIHLPSQIPACKDLIEKEEAERNKELEPDEADYYTDSERRLVILERDRRKCVYCLIDLSEDSYFLDHLAPLSKGGTHRKFNLVAACEGCNQRKRDKDPIEFLKDNYRSQLINQNEYLTQKDYIENILKEAT